MNRILALETSSEACSVALLQDGRLDERHEVVARGHTRLILPMVDELLSLYSLSLTDLDAIAFGRGPGSFTGLRICAGVVQGLAFGAGLPVVPVSSLAAMALSGLRDQAGLRAGRALVCIDARMGELYFAAYDLHGERLEPAATECLTAPAGLCLADLMCEQGVILALGSGWQFMGQIPGVQAARFHAVDIALLPRAGAIARLGLEAWQRGEVVAAHQAEPVYLREQVAWKKTADRI